MAGAHAAEREINKQAEISPPVALGWSLPWGDQWAKHEQGGA